MRDLSTLYISRPYRMIGSCTIPDHGYHIQALSSA